MDRGRPIPVGVMGGASDAIDSCQRCDFEFTFKHGQVTDVIPVKSGKKKLRR